MSETSQIKDFFKNQTVFLTGGSGFLGKILIEKLLRECEDLKKIYVLMRAKKGKTSEERFGELFSYPCFDRLKSTNPNAMNKVSLVNGDCQLPYLGLGEQNLNILKKETTCVIHAAANVKFDQTLKEATSNVRSTKDLLEIAKQMPNLRAFVFVSTAFSNCIHSTIKEEFYKPPMTAETLLALVQAVDDDILESITPTILGEWPNTYVYSKSIAEDLVKDACDEVPVAIVRPSIVCSTNDEPMPGWIDNFYGVSGIVAAAALGLIRSLHAKLDAKAYMVPADFVSNCILAAAWRREKFGETQIYNFTGSDHTIMTWGTFMKKVEPFCWAAASEKVVWYYCFKLRENKLWHNICIFFLHTVVAYLVDFILFCCGKKTLAVENYRRLNKMLDLISYFSTRDWIFYNDNVNKLWKEMNEEDKLRFNFDLDNVDVDTYMHDSVFGARQYLLKDTIDTIPKGNRKLKILCVAHYTLLAVFYYLLYKLFSYVFSRLW